MLKIEQDDIILECKVGRFLFDPNTPLSHTKLVRDTVMGQMLNPKPGDPRVFDEQSAREYVQSCSGSFAMTPFAFIRT